MPKGPTDYIVHPSERFFGDFRVSGDKSISHRALIIAALAQGTSNINNIATGDDVMMTIKALQALGVIIEGELPNVTVYGKGPKGFTKPNAPIDCGNSGTTARLLLGLLAGLPFDVTLIGDSSLSKRPMKRVLAPLSKMGVSITSPNETLPITICGNSHLRPTDYTLQVPSAQVKSALMIAALYVDGTSTLIEPIKTRDHTERLLQATNAHVLTTTGDTHQIIGAQALKAFTLNIPGDFSSASFMMAAALMARESSVTCFNVGLNPTRTGLLTLFDKMGAEVTTLNETLINGEPVGDIRVKSAQLKAVDVDASLFSATIDELPIFSILALKANGESHFKGVRELRYKESDRIEALYQGLKSLNGDVIQLDDGLAIKGGTLQSGVVDSYDDHRIAMSFALCGFITNAPFRIKNTNLVASSFRSFLKVMQQGGLMIEEVRSDR